MECDLMQSRKSLSIGLVTLWGTIGAMALTARVGATAEAPNIEQVFAKHRPQNGDVEYDIPDPKTYKQCKISLIDEGKLKGWVVTGPAGQILRRFMDTNGDGIVDQWSFYRAGLEVYRDIDSNGNAKIDQSRWLNLGGTRWGVDSNESGRIDTWKSISAEEVSRIAVRALVSQDASLLAPLLVNKNDLKELGIKGPLETKLLASVADPAAKLKKNVTGSKSIHAKTVWLRFDASPPGVIPADSFKTPSDLYVYENVMAIVDTGNPQQPALVNVGELIRIGDVWKMTMIPQPLEGNRELAAGLVMFHVLGASPTENTTIPASSTSEKTNALVEKLKKELENPPAISAGKPVFEKYYKQVENILIELVNESKADDDRAQWTRQLIDTVAAAVQSGNYPTGVARLKQIEAEIVKAAPKSPMVPVARYRRMLAEYAAAMQDAKSNNDTLQKVHAAWLKDLETFLDDFPKAEDAPEASHQLAVALEFGGKLDKAKKWYQRIVSDHGDSTAAVKAAGALQRIELDDKTLVLSGAALAGGGTIDIKQFRGKVVLVQFWDTTSKLCADDLPQIKALHDEYRSRGFEVIGVNLDPVKEVVGPYLEKNKLKWPQIYEPGGLESAPARSFGIILLPTMFLVDAEGKVTNRSATVADVKRFLAETYDKK
jgi:TolA-binding protein/peroxiredoxin